MEATQEKEKFLNGVNVDQLFNTIDLIKEKPDTLSLSKSFAFMTLQ